MMSFESAQELLRVYFIAFFVLPVGLFVLLEVFDKIKKKLK